MELSFETLLCSHKMQQTATGLKKLGIRFLRSTDFHLKVVFRLVLTLTSEKPQHIMNLTGHVHQRTAHPAGHFLHAEPDITTRVEMPSEIQAVI